MERIYNFSAGPSMLPLPVLEDVSKNLTNYKGSGMSILEMSHRGSEYSKIHNEAKENLKKLMGIPDEYKILFLQGGATLQFSAIPLNLGKKYKRADYIDTGAWANKAYKEASKFIDAKVIASSKEDNYTYIPKNYEFRDDIDYAYITGNNTIYGTSYRDNFPSTNTPLICDLSSSILSEPVDVSKFGLIYAGAQKNIGPSGLTIVIVREDLLPTSKNDDIPVYLDYFVQSENDSLYNTPPTFQIYFAGEVFKYLHSLGGLKKMKELNEDKANILYDFIDSSNLFSSPVNKEDRSLMNVVFITGNETLDKKFILEAKVEGLYNLGGHRSIGGMRASIYNAMPKEGILKLISFMQKFEKENS